MNDLLAAERSRRNLRIALFVIIVATMPFYCFGIILLANPPPGTVNPSTRQITTQQVLPTNTVFSFASVTPLPQQGNSTLAPTPGQFFPTVRIITQTFVFPTTAPTDFIFPTLTIAPTLTLAPPTETPYPTLTSTTIPLPTFTETSLPMPTDTETPTSTPTETPTPGV